MKLFVSGGAGFIGSNFIRYTLGLGKGHKVVNYDKLTYAGNLAMFSPSRRIPTICSSRAIFVMPPPSSQP